MINKQRLYLIALVSASMILMLVSIGSAAPFAYIPNFNSNNVYVIDTATDTVTATVNVESHPMGVAVTPDATKVYVTNEFSNTVSVIDTATNQVTANVSVGNDPMGIAVSPDGTKVYVTNVINNTVSVIDTATNNVIVTANTAGNNPFGVVVSPDGTKLYVANLNTNTVSIIDTAIGTVTATVNVGSNPMGIAVNPVGTKVYVTNEFSNTVSVINTTTNQVTANVSVGSDPMGVAVSPDGTKVYVTNVISNTISVINTATNTVIATVNTIGNYPYGVAVTPDGTKVYVTNFISDTISVIDTTTNAVTDTVPVGNSPYAFGQFIGKPAFIITWNNPANITYGTALDDTQLDATASVPGTFVYTPPSGTILSAGLQQTLNTTFTPTDNVNYTQANATVLINVTQATPTIIWNVPADITSRTTLTATQLDAFAINPVNRYIIKGSWVYTTPTGTSVTEGTVLDVDRQTLTATFTPDDAVNYTSASVIGYINVTPVTPTNRCGEEKEFCGQEKGFTAKFKSTDQINEDENICHTKNIKEKKEYYWQDRNIDEHAMIYKPIFSSVPK